MYNASDKTKICAIFTKNITEDEYFVFSREKCFFLSVPRVNIVSKVSAFTVQ
jgi:hypothetical protein